jgi:hypothetical protein
MNLKKQLRKKLNLMSDLELMIEDNKAKPYLVSEEEGHQNEIDNLLFFDAINSAEKLGKSKSYIEELREKGMYLASKIYAETTKISPASILSSVPTIKASLEISVTSTPES